MFGYISNLKNPDVQIDIDLGCIYSYPPKKNVKSMDICGLQAQRLTVASCVPSRLRQAGAAWVGDTPEWPKISGNSGPVPKMGGIPHLYIL